MEDLEQKMLDTSKRTIKEMFELKRFDIWNYFYHQEESGKHIEGSYYYIFMQEKYERVYHKVKN
jgi:hypothetical protein